MAAFLSITLDYTMAQIFIYCGKICVSSCVLRPRVIHIYNLYSINLSSFCSILLFEITCLASILFVANIFRIDRILPFRD